MGFVENGSMGCFKSLYECAAQIRKYFEKPHLDFCKDPFPEKTKPSLALEPRQIPVRTACRANSGDFSRPHSRRTAIVHEKHANGCRMAMVGGTIVAFLQ